MVTLRNALRDMDNTTQDIQIGKTLHTMDGGDASQYINRTGHISIKGETVALSTLADDEVVLILADSPNPIGAVYEAGVAEGGLMWVTTQKDAYCLLENGTGAVAGNWAKVSDTADGRVDASNAAPSGGTIVAINDHFTECGHVEEAATAGTDVLCKVHLHYL
jgi:hypothetical protein